uniref:GMC_oxred_C domain-containing protein n=1 Tax=Elaeophora elaphi TaxID=1147741 RepID=A0A0R3RSE2_9BILA
MSNRKTESAPYVMLPGTSNLGIGDVIPSTAPLVDVETHRTSDVPHNGSFLKFFNVRCGVMNIFGRGFLAEPVLRDEEESYRYLMALDRY